MRTTDEKCLHFVLRHYQKNKLDTQKALKAFKEKYRDNGTGTEILPLVVDTSRYGGSHSWSQSLFIPASGKTEHGRR
ncbi:hypothetical protein NXW48_12070 [Phocaeicola vulgatus]|nr:hypothetical protein [Phocaeicola vulgatus]